MVFVRSPIELILIGIVAISVIPIVVDFVRSRRRAASVNRELANATADNAPSR